VAAWHYVGMEGGSPGDWAVGPYAGALVEGPDDRRMARDARLADGNVEAGAERPADAGPRPYLPALDGLRAFAVMGVVAYHFSLHWADGGYLGVDFFFVLSGFLITGLLVGEWSRARTIALRSFWFRRSKRLLPAVMVLLIVLSVYAWCGGPNIVPSTFGGDAIATLFYYANWHLIVAHQSYFAQFQAPSPLRHMWSLAIEEQFYLIWPLTVVLGLRLGRRRSRGVDPSRPARPPWWRRMQSPGLFWCTVALAAASAIEMTVLFDRHPATDISRIYYGTDTRAFELLIGAALALMMAGDAARSRRTQHVLRAAAPVAAVTLACLWVTGGDDAGNPVSWMFQGGLLVAGLLAAVVIAGVAQPDAGAFGALLSIRPLRWIGRISYGIYLWHWPVYVLMTDVTTGLQGTPLLGARLAATMGAATISFYLVEYPIRHYQWKGWTYVGTMTAGATATIVAVAVGSVSVAAPDLAMPRSRAAAVVSYAAIPKEVPPPIVLPALRVPSAADPLRIMTLGDSVMVNEEAALQASLQSTGAARVTTHGFDGWGLVNDQHMQTDLASVIAQNHPDIIVAMWSWDNAFAEQQPTVYREILTEAIDVMLTPGNGVDGVAIVQFPKVGPRPIIDPTARLQDEVSAEEGRGAFDRIAALLPAHYPGRVTYLPVASSLEINGEFSAWLRTPGGGWVRARKTDNTHLCPVGAAVLATAVTAELTPMLRLPAPAAGWQLGPWASDQTRFGPAGSCPDDQPTS